MIEALPPYQSVLRLLDHQLTAIELANLIDRLRSDEVARRQAAALLLQIGVLGELARERDEARLPRRPRAAPRLTVGLLALCAGLAAAIALLVVGLHGPTRPHGAHRAPAFARPVTRRPSVIAAAPGGLRLLLVRGGDLEQAGDATLVGHLQGLGFDVVEVADAELAAADVRNADLVVISASALGKVVRERVPAAGLRDAPVPIVTCESATFDLLGMTAPRTDHGLTARGGFGSAPGHSALAITAPGHPLTADLEGIVTVASTEVPLTWGVPTSAAIRVATLDTNPLLVVQFAYERGAAMTGLRAPARRVGCFISADAAELVTAEGWALFDAGVKWASGL